MSGDPRAAVPLLMTPGPSRVPERVLQAGARPMLHHRSAEFSASLARTVEGVRGLFGASGDVLPLHTTGRGGMEGAVCNLFSPGDELVACCNGKFGEMWAGIAETYGLMVHRVATDWTRGVDPLEVDAALRAHPRARAVTLVQSDTSTGVLNDVQGVAAVARAHGVLCMVDCISALGGIPFRFDDWGVDVAVAASQKCLMSSAGLAFVAVSDRAWEADRTARLPHSYIDFAAIRKSLAGSRPETPGSTPVHLVLQVEAALRMIEEEGVENVFARHEAMAALARERTAALGLSPPFPGLDRRSPTLTPLLAPDGVTPKAIRDYLRERGVLVAGGLGPYTSTVFRIGHLGDIRPADVERTLDLLAEALAHVTRDAPTPPLAPLG